MRRVAGSEPRSPAAIVTALLGLVGGIALIGEFRMPLNADAGYHVDAARRMLGEEALYWDLVTPDPPFIFWLSLPMALLGLDGPGTIAAYRVFVLLLIAGAVALAWPALREAPATLAGFLLMAIVLPIGYFGQREHLQYVLTFPYLAFCALRSPRSA